MRIFFIHQFYKTPEEGGGIRSWYVTRALQQAGHDVTVLAAEQIQNTKYELESASGFKDEDRLRNASAITVIRLPVGWSNSMSFWQRVMAFVKFLYLARKESKKHSYDLVYAISVPLTTGLLAIWTKKPFVFEVGDLWPDVPVQMKILRNPILKYFSYRLEKKIYQKAELIISLSKDIQRHIYQKWPFTANIVIENFSDLALFDANNKEKTVENVMEGIQNSKFKIEIPKSSGIFCTYVGTAGIANDLMQMVELAKVAEKNFPQIKFNMMISGKEEEKIKTAAPSNMHFIDYGNKQKVVELLTISDFNFVTYAQYPILGTGSPNKFFDGLSAACITVINVKGWIEELIESKKAGLFWDINKPNEILEKIQIISEDKALIKQYKSNAFDLSVKFDHHILTQKIAEQIESRF